jgi:hypothetical protein
MGHVVDVIDARPFLQTLLLGSYSVGSLGISTHPLQLPKSQNPLADLIRSLFPIP